MINVEGDSYVRLNAEAVIKRCEEMKDHYKSLNEEQVQALYRDWVNSTNNNWWHKLLKRETVTTKDAPAHFKKLRERREPFYHCPEIYYGNLYNDEINLAIQLKLMAKTAIASGDMFVSISRAHFIKIF